uniref:SH2 domain-containing protein n=1 Tax=Setaria digitata TaxID=48799 RepID=A0A915Q8B0_9BILA
MRNDKEEKKRFIATATATAAAAAAIFPKLCRNSSNCPVKPASPPGFYSTRQLVSRMSESHTSSASASTILSVTSDLPLDDTASAETKLDKTSNSLSLRNAETDLVNRKMAKNSENDAVDGGSILENSHCEKDQFVGNDQEFISENDPKLTENVKQDLIDHSALYQTNSEKMVRDDVPRVVIKSDQMRDISVKQENPVIWVTAVDAPAISDVSREMQGTSPKSVDRSKQTLLQDVLDEKPIANSFEETSANTSAETLPVTSDGNLTANAAGTNSNFESLCLAVDHSLSSTTFESHSDQVLSRSLDNRTTSESPIGANDSWKNATINMNLPANDRNARSAYSTTLRNHQTKIIYNNKTLNLGEVIHHHPLFVKNTSKYWYKPTISREEAVNMLRDKPPGTFVVRDSNSFPGAFGLALKVATPPPGVHPGDGTELVRHFLIEPSPKGVKLKGCNNEPIFGTLSALVYQHSIIPLALPTKLLLPEYDPANTPEHISAAQQLLQQGAACNVTYIVSLDTESLTGPEAARRCIDQAFELLKQKMIQPVSVHFKASFNRIISAWLLSTRRLKLLFIGLQDILEDNV